MNLKDLNKKRNVDLTTVNTGMLTRLDMRMRSLIDAAFTSNGVILFVAGVVFGLGAIARHH